jgi:chemotaxis-related protein WspD
MELLERDASAADRARWTARVAEPNRIAERETESVVIFRVGLEWLALPTTAVAEVANRLPIHSLPHRPIGVILGLTSVRGELLVCMSLAHVLGIDPGAAGDQKPGHTAHPRLLVIRREARRAVCPVDDVHGVHRFHRRELKDVPSTVARSTATYSKAVLPWQDRFVGVLDDEPLFSLLKRSVA